MIKRINFIILLFFVIYIINISKGNEATTNSFDSKLIQLSLVSNWGDTPNYIEACEFFSKQDKLLYWKFLEEFNSKSLISKNENNNNNNNSSLDKINYELSVNTAKEILLPSTRYLIEFLSIDLSMRTYSPIVETFRQLAISQKNFNENGWIQLSNGKVITNSNEINDQLIESLTTSTREKEEIDDELILFEFDHIYPISSGNSVGDNGDLPLVILYSDLKNEFFKDVHPKLKQYSKTGKIRYCFRYIIKESNQKFNLQGYGFELSIKNLEYKVMDDSAIKKDIITDGGKSKTIINIPNEDISGFNFNKLLNRKPELTSKLSTFRSYLLAKSQEAKELKVWELKDLGIQSAQKIIQSNDPLRSLRHISQKFPTISSYLSKTTVNETLKKQIESNQKSIPSTETILLLNGRSIPVDDLNPIGLSHIIQEEYESATTIQSCGPITSESVDAIIAKSFDDSVDTPIRIKFYPNEEELSLASSYNPLIPLNNLEMDYQYRSWENSLRSLEDNNNNGDDNVDTQSGPSDIFMRKNLLTTTFVLDWNDISTTFSILPEIQQMIQSNVPTRFVFVFYTKESTEKAQQLKSQGYVSAKDLAKIFLSFKNSNVGNRGALFFVTALNYFKKMHTPNDEGITRSVLSSAFQTVLNQMHSSFRSLQGGLQSTEYNGLLDASNQFIDRMSITQFPQILLNGLPIEYQSMEQLSSQLLVSLYDEFERLKPLYKDGILIDQPNTQLGQFQLYQTITTTPYWSENSSPLLDKYSSILFNSNYSYFVTNSKNQLKEIEAQNVFKKQMFFIYNQNDDNFVESANNEEIESSKLLNIYIIGDFDQYNTRDITLSMLKQLKSISYKSFKSSRLSIYSNPINPVATTEKSQPLGKLISILKHYKKEITLDRIIELFESIQKDVGKYEQIKSVKELIEHYKLPIQLNDIWVSQSDNLFKQQSKTSREYLNIYSTNKQPISILVNGKIIQPPHSYENVDDFLNDFNMVLVMEEKKSNQLLSILKNDKLLQEQKKQQINYSDLINKISSLVGYYYKSSSHIQRKRIPSSIQTSFTYNPSLIKSSPSSLPLKFFMVINPFNKISQKLVPMLQEFSNKLSINVDVVLNPPVSVSELPLKTFYTYVIKLDNEFSEETGQLINQPLGIASNIPEDRVLTLALDAPSSWLVQPIVAKYDLDNIRLKDLGEEQVLYAVFELENIVIEGSCNDVSTDSAPAGLEILLNPVATKNKHKNQDTIVMHNYGYYQLKSNPGIWKLTLAKGRSSDIMNIIEPNGLVVPYHTVVIDSLFQSQQSLYVVRKQGQERTPILQPIQEYEKQKEKEQQEKEKQEENNTGFFSNLFNNNKQDQANKQVNNKKKLDTIHIFSVASGHLYERFLKIMMLSVTKNTENPVKFWFLKNYLSPGFKDFIPQMAKEYGFEYELVTYKWPWWLRKQTEKQRIIWSYKILFLDVLFPLNVPKIIFVDADQVVRTDMRELWDMDLHGASLGYTPFCDSNKDTEGFRFWKQGYWRQHLGDRPYHISALYVVDLVRFRRLAAGDQLRATYDQLSKDPNSLANLDQDLPNYLQHYVRIHSLPQEWLWCETWCDQNSKSKAKTIDLCNNPLTKTPKLENAVRIIEEWTSLDNEAKEFELKLEKLKEKESQIHNEDDHEKLINTKISENVEDILSKLDDAQKDFF